MAKKFEILRAKISPKDRAVSLTLAQKMMDEMPLNEPRQARGHDTESPL